MTTRSAAEILGVDKTEVENTIIDVLFKASIVEGRVPSEIDLKRVIRFIERTQLNPFDGTMFVRWNEFGEVEPGLRVDGWLQLAKQGGVKEIVQSYSDNFIKYPEFRNDVRGHEWIETILVTTEGGRYVHREYLAENFYTTKVWMEMPNRSLGHKSTCQTIRLFTGVYAADEWQKTVSPTEGGLTVLVDNGAADTELETAAVAPAVKTETTAATLEVEAVVEIETTAPEKPELVVETQETVPASVEPIIEDSASVSTAAVKEETPTVAEVAEENVSEPMMQNHLPVTLEEIIQYPWGGHLPSAKMRGDVRVGFTRAAEQNAWVAIRGYFANSLSMSDEDREWTLKALDQMENVINGRK